MTPEKLKKLEAELKPCKCGGRCYISEHKHKPQKGLVHLAIKCEKCGAWRGGITHKDDKL
jgi:hypothetical protein